MSSKALIIMLVGSLLIGALVLIVKSDYRIDKVLKSNKKYYPLVKVEGKE